MPPARTKDLIAPGLILGLAIMLRLFYFQHLRQLPFFDHPIMDASYHDTWAREIAGGQISRGEPFFRAPLYPYLLALVYKLSGGSYVWPRLLQFLLGALTSLTAFGLAKRSMGLTAGMVAGALCAAYPVLIYFDGELLTETLFTFLVMVGLLLVDVAARGQTPASWFPAGLALGLALVTRPTVALFLPLAAVGCWFFARRKKAATLLLLAGLLMPLAPVTIYNYAVSGEFIPVVWQGGINFYLGNNPAADGWSATAPEIRKDWWGGYRDMIAIPRQALGRQPSYREVSSFWQAKGLRFIRSQPRQWASLMLKKVALFWSSLEFPNNQDYNFARLQSWVLRNPLVNFGVVAPLGLVGILVGLSRWRRFYFLYAFLVAHFAVTVAFFVCSRYRAPALPVICVFAGGLVTYLIQATRTRRWKTLIVSLLGVAGAALVVNTNLSREQPPDLAQSYTQVGKVYVEKGQDQAAREYLERAVAENPEWGEAYEQLGLVEMKEGHQDKAKRYLLKAVEVMPAYAPPYRSLAMLYLAEGDLQSARRSTQTALSLAPYLEDVRNLMGSIQRQEGKLDSAVVWFKREIEVNPGNWRAYANLGGIYCDRGELDQARQAYEKAVALNPQDASLAGALAAIYTRQGRNDLAASLLDRQQDTFPQDLNLRYNQAVILQNNGRLDEAARIYQEILREAPSHEGALVNLGVIYAKEGRGDDALQLWQRALSINPENRNARRNIELLRQSLPVPQ